MANSLNQYNSDIENGDIIQPEHILQFAKAFTGEEAYDIAVSGSFILNGNEVSSDINYIEITATRNNDDFNSIRELMESINDASYYNRYIINIPEGRWFECDINGKKYVELKGSGMNDTIIYSDGTSTKITPLNYSYGANHQGVALNTIPTDYKHVIFQLDDLKLSNLTIEGKQGKYAAHIDNGLKEFTFEATNCKFEVITSSAVIGMGIHSGQNMIFNKCIFKGYHIYYSSFYIHNAGNKPKSGNLTLSNCHFDTAYSFFYEELGGEVEDNINILNCTSNLDIQIIIKSLVGYYVNPNTGLIETNPTLIPYITKFNLAGTDVKNLRSQSAAYTDNGIMTRPLILDYVSSNYAKKVRISGILKYDLIQGPNINSNTYSKYNGTQPFVGIALTDTDAGGYVYFAKDGDYCKATITGSMGLYVNINSSNLLEFSSFKTLNTIGTTVSSISSNLYQIKLSIYNVGLTLTNSLTETTLGKALDSTVAKTLNDTKYSSLQNTGNINIANKQVVETLVGIGFSLNNANLAGVDLEFSNLSYADLRNTNLNGANLVSVDLSFANLTGSNLENANLNLSNLTNTDLTNTILLNASFEGVQGLDSDINIYASVINTDPNSDGMPWSLTWIYGLTYTWNPEDSTFEQL